MKKRVLVVDDNRDLRDCLQELLANCGYDVFTAADGDEAIDLIDKEKPDLVITDLEMPRCNGLTVAAYAKSIRIIEKDFSKNIAVILMTGNPGALSDEAEKFTDQIIFKPFHLQDVSKMASICTL